MADIPQYQDIWVKGQVQSRGLRECAERYELIHKFCAQYKRPFTVLDVGAADGYFAVRLTEDFPECTVVAIEYRPRIGEVLARNAARRVLWLNKRVTLEDIRGLAAVEHFDVTLALSVIHWLHAPPAESINALQALGDHLILELPVETTATGQEVVQMLTAPYGGEVLGHGRSHLDPAALRPVYLLSQSKTGLMRGYWGSPRDAHVVINSSFESKTFVKGKKVSYPFMRGINLQTFLTLNGAHPSRVDIAGRVRKAYGKYMRGTVPHGDLVPWNVILQGDRAVLIDAKPGGERDARDTEFLERLVVTIMGGA